MKLQAVMDSFKSSCRISISEKKPNCISTSIFSHGKQWNLRDSLYSMWVTHIFVTSVWTQPPEVVKFAIPCTMPVIDLDVANIFTFPQKKERSLYVHYECANSN